MAAYDVFALNVQDFEFDEIPDQLLTVGEAFELDLTDFLPSEFNGTVTLKSSTSLPPNFTLNTNTGIIKGTPRQVFTQVYSPVFIAMDGGATAESNPVNINTRHNASFDTIPTQTGEQGVSGSIDLAPYINDGFPSGWTLSIDPTDTAINAFTSLSGTVLEWTPPIVNPDAAKTYDIPMVLTDPTDASNQVTTDVVLQVPKRIVDTAPEWSRVPSQSGRVRTTFRVDLNNYVSGTPTPNIAVAAGYTLPTGWSLTNGVFSGRRGNTVGTQTFRFTASNRAGTVTSGDVSILTTSGGYNPEY